MEAPLQYFTQREFLHEFYYHKTNVPIYYPVTYAESLILQEPTDLNSQNGFWNFVTSKLLALFHFRPSSSSSPLPPSYYFNNFSYSFPPIKRKTRKRSFIHCCTRDRKKGRSTFNSPLFFMLRLFRWINERYKCYKRKWNQRKKNKIGRK